MTIPLRQRPRLTPAEAADLAAELFGVRGEPSPLDSERDQNVLITAADGARWVLKLSNAAEPLDLVEMQVAILERLHEADGPFRFPHCLPSNQGRLIEIVGHEGRQHAVRLLPWIDGVPLAGVRPHDRGLLGELGRLIGSVRSALDGFHHGAAARTLKWDLTRAREEISARLPLVAEPRRRELVQRLLERSWSRVQRRAAALRRGVLHNDANDYNVLCGPPRDQAPLRRRNVVGLLDVGDAIEGWLVGDLAIAIAYGILDKNDVLGAARAIVGGCRESFPLQEGELEVVLDLATLRLCTTVCVAAEQRASEPSNEYLSISEAPAWATLQRLAAIHPRLAAAHMRHAGGFEPAPDGRRVGAWIHAHRDALHAVVDVPLESATTHVFDLSVGSTEMGNGAPGNFDAVALGRRLFGMLAAAGKQVGIGRWNEARCWYGGELFAAPSDEAPRRRTVHLGVDVFLPAGSPVRAALAGRVVGSRDNAGELDYGPTLVLEHEPEPGLRFWTLHGHLTPESLADSPVGRSVAAGERIGAIGDAPGNGGWPPHLHLQVITDLLDEDGNFPGVAAPDERDIWCSLCPDAGPLLGLPAALLPAPNLEAGAIRRLRDHHLGPSLSLSYRRPLHIVRGYGQQLWDVDGQPYLDAVNNVPHVGHCHPRVVAAANAQNEVLTTNTRYLHANLVRYAERLLATLPPPLSVVYLVCSGSEANELAIRMARAHTGRHDMVVVEAGYHGNTTTLVDVSHYKHAGPGGSGAPEWVHVAALPDVYRGPHRGEDAAVAYAADVARALGDAEPAGGAAAFLVEPLVGCGGQIVPPAGYLQRAFAHARAAGALCIADEVQIGFGRVGTHMWAFEAQGAAPDILTLGKPIGNGFPLAAVVTTAEIAASFANGMEYFNTFGGNPVACAAGLAVLDVLEQERLLDNAAAAGDRLLHGLRELGARHGIVGDARGVGLYVGVELVRNRETLEPAAAEASYVINRMRDHGILVSTDGPLHNVLKIKPPMCFTPADADRLVAALDAVLKEDTLLG